MYPVCAILMLFTEITHWFHVCTGHVVSMVVQVGYKEGGRGL